MNRLLWVALGLVLAGCSSQSKAVLHPLRAPAGTSPAVAAQLEQGNKQFVAQDWAGAKAAYQQSIAAEPTLAEAHYNLGLTLDQLGDKTDAKKHYFEAANLAPGNKVIWDAPPLRKRAVEAEFKKDSYMDATPNR